MTDKTSVRSREMGAGLKTQREQERLGLREVARRAGWSAAKVSSWEHGRRISAVDAAIYLATCGTKDPERARLLELTKPPSDLYWVRPYFDQLVDPMKSLIIQESLTTAMADYAPMILPGLLQTEDYARRVFDLIGQVPKGRVELLINARMDRQNVLQRHNPPWCKFFIHERALRSGAACQALMHEQLQYLVLMSGLPHCAIRIVEETAPAFQLFPDAFTLMEFDEHPAVAYLETSVATMFVDDRLAVEVFFAAVTRLEQAALSEEQSRELLIRLAGEYERKKE